MNTAFLIALLALASLATLVHLQRRRSSRVQAQRTRITRGLQLAVDRNCYPSEQ
jgi:hypothetical protein